MTFYFRIFRLGKKLEYTKIYTNVCFLNKTKNYVLNSKEGKWKKSRETMINSLAFYGPNKMLVRDGDSS